MADTQRDLLDEDGENRALRSFLMQYGLPGLTVGAMRDHMKRSGWGGEYWPFFVSASNRDTHLTKGGAQVWIRHLLAMEVASRPAEVDDQIPRESNDALIALARYWKLNGDWMTCKGCRRSLIASRDGEELAHGDGCKYWDQQHPWAQLRELITRRPAPAGAAQ